MSLYKALITDLDNTVIELASKGDDISTSLVLTIKEAQEQGYKIACATGRRWSFTKEIVTKLGITSPCIIQGGSSIVDPKTNKVLWEKHLDEDAVEAVFDMFKRETEEGSLSTFHFRHKPLNSFYSAPADARFMYLLGVTELTASKISNIINSQAFAVAHVTNSWQSPELMDIHVTHQEATKEHAIKIWQKLEGVSKDQTIGMGDSGNDVPLFLSAGLKIAVGNATQELKNLADYIAPKQNEDALAFVIKKFLLS